MGSTTSSGRRATATTKQPKAPTVPGSKEGKPSRRPTLALGTALLALATGSLGLVFTFWPGLRPDPRVTQSATLRVAAVDPGTSLSEYLRRLGSPTAAKYSTQQGCIPGDLYYVEEHLEGFKDRTTALRYFLYDARTGRRIKGALSSVSGVQAAIIRSTRPTDQSISLIWARWPLHRAGTFFVRFELYRSGTFLNLVDGPKFKLEQSSFADFSVECIARGGK